jgi:hypothetical protein
MAKQTITRRQKDIARLLREKKAAYPAKIKAQFKGRLTSKP